MFVFLWFCNGLQGMIQFEMGQRFDFGSGGSAARGMTYSSTWGLTDPSFHSCQTSRLEVAVGVVLYRHTSEKLQ